MQTFSYLIVLYRKTFFCIAQRIYMHINSNWTGQYTYEIYIYGIRAETTKADI